MGNPTESERTELTIINTLNSARPDVLQSIVLYGSRARGDHRPDSDYDLGILLDGRADPVMVWEVAQTIASQLMMDVDLVDFRAATTVLQKRSLPVSAGCRREMPFPATCLKSM